MAETVLLSPRFRVAFPQVDVAKAFQANQKPRWSCVALFTPAEFTDKDKEKWKAIIAACNAVSIEAFKKPMKDLDRSVYKTPFHKGEEKAQYSGFGPGVIFFTMAAYNRKPQIIDLHNAPVDPSDFYPGCYARASVNPYAFDNIGKGVAIGMNNLRKLAEGERLDGASSAEDDFGSDPEEFADAGGDDSTDDMGIE